MREELMKKNLLPEGTVSGSGVELMKEEDKKGRRE